MPTTVAAGFVAFALDALARARQGESDAFVALDFLLDRYLVLPTEIGLTFEEYSALEARRNEAEEAREAGRLQDLLRRLRDTPNAHGLSVLRERSWYSARSFDTYLQTKHRFDLLARLGVSKDELAQLERQARCRFGEDAFFAQVHARFSATCLSRFDAAHRISFEEVTAFFRAHAVRPEELGTSEEALREAWRRSRVEHAAHLWGRLCNPQGTEGDTPELVENLAAVLGQGIAPHEFGGSPSEVEVRLRQARLRVAAWLLKGTQGSDGANRFPAFKSFCERHGVSLAELSPGETFASLGERARASQAEDRLENADYHLHERCEEYGIRWPATLTEGCRKALVRQVSLLDAWRNLAGDYVCFGCYDEDGDAYECLRRVGSALYGYPFSTLSEVNRAGRPFPPAERLGHEELPITREAFVERMRDALVVHLRDELERALSQSPFVPELEDWHLLPERVLARIHACVHAQVATYEELGATPMRMIRLMADARDLERSLATPKEC